MVKKSPRKVKRISPKRSSKKKRSPTAWNKHLMKVYNDGKKKNNGYSFTSAMKDAKKTYKK